MNVNTNTRYLGRTIQLFTCDSSIGQVQHSETVRISDAGLSGVGTGRASERDEATLHLEDGKQVSLSEFGSRFNVHAGDRVTAVGARHGRRSTSYLYFFNHNTRRSMFHRPGWKALKRGRRMLTTFVVLPLLLLLVLWLSPAHARANMAGWVEQHVVHDRVAPAGKPAPKQAASKQAASNQTGRVIAASTNESSGMSFDTGSMSEAVRSIADSIMESAPGLSFEEADHALRAKAVPAVTAGWREQNWIIFSITAAIVVGVMLVLRSIITMLATRLLRRRVKRLVQHHRRALAAM